MARGVSSIETVRMYIASLAEEKTQSSAFDWAYVENFGDSRKPKALPLPRGEGETFAKLMKEHIAQLKDTIPTTLSSEAVEHQKREISQLCLRQSMEMVAELNEMSRKNGFLLQQVEGDFRLLPLKEDGSAYRTEEYSLLTDEQQAEYVERSRPLSEMLTKTLRQSALDHRERARRIGEYEKEVVSKLLVETFSSTLEAFCTEEVTAFILSLQEDVVENLQKFKPEQPMLFPGQQAQEPTKDIAERYIVNVVVSSKDSLPVIVETNPSYGSLLGRVERQPHYGVWITNHTLIRGGTLHQANGGYLIVDLEHLLRTPLSYNLLKRILRESHIKITDPSEELFAISSQGLEPEPIPLNVRIVVIGDPVYWHLIQTYDAEFAAAFPIVAHFDDNVSLTHVDEFTSWLNSYTRQEGLSPLDEEAVREIVKYSCKLTGDKKKLSSETHKITSLLREAHYNSEGNISSNDIRKTVAGRLYRSGVYRTYIEEMIDRDQLMLSLRGEEIGAINGLAVIVAGEMSVGFPTRITARTWFENGKRQIISVERSAELSGKTFNQGLERLSGYIQSHYLPGEQFSLSASIAMEQTRGVDGDSATLAEAYIILSSIANIPLKQNFAVTGTLDQTGKVLPVGGISSKIEGFYEACRIKGVKNASVIVPEANKDNVLLPSNILESIERGEFSVYTVNHLDEGILLLTGLEAGERDIKTNKFKRGSLHAIVEKRLQDVREINRKKK